MSKEDFPAAHSMDTEWFAVDGEGNVASFSTGEAGAAPESAMAYYEDVLAVLDIIRQFPPGSTAEYEVDDLIAMEGGPVFDFSWRIDNYETASFSDAQACFSVLMWLKDESLFQGNSTGRTGFVRRLFQRAAQELEMEIVRIPNSKYLLGYTDGPMTVSTLQRLVQDGKVLKAWVNHGLSSSRIGIFEYSHGDMFENWIAGPYMRIGSPKRPLKLHELPEEAQEIFAQTRFKSRNFARDEAIDPREAGPCTSWDPSYVGLDGLVHRVDEDNDEVV